MTTNSRKNPDLFSVFWIITLLFWLTSAFSAYFSSVGIGLVLAFTGPLAAFGATVALSCLNSFCSGKPRKTANSE